jgi:hypothetical protein
MLQTYEDHLIRMYYILRIFDKKVVDELMKLFGIVTPQT